MNRKTVMERILLQTFSESAGSQILTTLVRKISVFWDMTPCGLLKDN
jgi:hypothetical protein